MPDQPVVLAFSGGLDTSYCLVLLRERGRRVVTVTVNTGGLLDAEMGEIEARALALGAESHLTVDARDRLYDEFVSHLLRANYLRNGVYPSCVGVERMVQAEEVTKEALKLGAGAIAHGSTGAGNDHVRFDVVIRATAPEMPIMAIVRDESHTREAETEFLRARGVEVPDKTSAYSFNHGMLGTTIGGKETYGSTEYLPEEAWPLTRSIGAAPETPQELTVRFGRGLPVACEFPGPAPEGWEAGAGGGHRLLTSLNRLGALHGVGRGVHTGQTIMGIMGRLGFEAPGYFILLAAHRELERLVLSNRQQSLKAYLGGIYGDQLHEGIYYDPVMRDIERFLDASQERVDGEVRLELHKGNVVALGCSSPFSLLEATRDLGSTYGYGTSLWTGDEARAFARLYATSAMVVNVAGEAGRGAREAGKA
ncbi:MAG TPA: argininosuccinate synthase [Acidimicrobiales bacterium]|nr:argininosuccinate synthase [Acidimicrobiales bacterium]